MTNNIFIDNNTYRGTLSFDDRVINLTNKTIAELMDKILFFYKNNLKNGKDCLIISYISLGKQIKKSPQTIRRSIKKLESLGFIAVSSYHHDVYRKQLKIKVTEKWCDFDNKSSLCARQNKLQDVCESSQNEKNKLQNVSKNSQSVKTNMPETPSSATDLEPFLDPISYNINKISYNNTQDSETKLDDSPISLSDESFVLNNINEIEGKNKDRLKGKNQASANDCTTNPDTQHQPTPQGKSSTLKLTQFKKWWDTYNNKIDRNIAFKAYGKAIRRIKPDELQLLTEKYMHLRESLLKEKTQKKLKGSDMFVPDQKNPSTWLNNDCWDDERIKNVDLSTPEDKEQKFLQEIESTYQGEELIVRQRLYQTLGMAPYMVFVSKADLSFKSQVAELEVGGPTAQDELRKSYHELKNAFEEVNINQLIIKNMRRDTKDINLEF